MSDLNECPICYSVIEEEMILHCKHKFCKKCMDSWFDQKLTCPLCVGKLDNDEKQYLIIKDMLNLDDPYMKLKKDIFKLITWILFVFEVMYIYKYKFKSTFLFVWFIIDIYMVIYNLYFNNIFSLKLGRIDEFNKEEKDTNILILISGVTRLVYIPLLFLCFPFLREDNPILMLVRTIMLKMTIQNIVVLVPYICNFFKTIMNPKFELNK